MILLDTHVVAWLYAGDVKRFSASARERLDSEQLAVSPVVALELAYLREIGRIAEDGDAVLAALERTIGLRPVDCSVAELIRHACRLDWTRDPFDRLLAAHATLEQAPLLTADERLRTHLPLAVW